MVSIILQYHSLTPARGLGRAVTGSTRRCLTTAISTVKPERGRRHSSRLGPLENILPQTTNWFARLVAFQQVQTTLAGDRAQVSPRFPRTMVQSFGRRDQSDQSSRKPGTHLEPKVNPQVKSRWQSLCLIKCNHNHISSRQGCHAFRIRSSLGEVIDFPLGAVDGRLADQFDKSILHSSGPLSGRRILINDGHIERIFRVRAGNRQSIYRFISVLKNGLFHKLHNSLSNITRPQPGCRAKLIAVSEASKIRKQGTAALEA